MIYGVSGLVFEHEQWIRVEEASYVQFQNLPSHHPSASPPKTQIPSKN